MMRLGRFLGVLLLWCWVPLLCGHKSPRWMCRVKSLFVVGCYADLFRIRLPRGYRNTGMTKPRWGFIPTIYLLLAVKLRCSLSWEEVYLDGWGIVYVATL